MLPRLLVALVLLLAGVAGVRAADAEASSRAVSGVVELFTSQGCASCPPADAVLAKLARDPALVVLAYHVDYWDYIGWKDVHGSRDNTERQRAYAASLASGSVYTPQVVVNGRRQLAGTKEAAVRRAVGETALGPGDAAPVVALARRGERLHISADGKASADAAARPPVLLLVTFDPWSETAVERGENGGQTLGSANAVQSWRVLGMWEGRRLDIDLPLAMLQGGDRPVGCAAILQAVTPSGGPGAILAAAALKP